jgi:5-formyltetrahydrofolate cyclo-ligase
MNTVDLMNMPKMSLKGELRKEYLRQRAKLTSDRREEQSRVVREKVLALVDQERFTSVHCYVSLGTELGTKELITELWLRAIKVICPRVESQCRLSHHEVRSWNDLGEGSFGVLEPLGEDRLAHEDIPLILVPGLAFTKQGDRLGYGKGYYDRFLAKNKVTSLIVGLAFDEQLVSDLAVESHDCRCHEVFSPS